MEYCKNITNVNFSFNSISDLSPLKGLDSLVEIDISHNLITDISPLSNLVKLVL
ncbi:leucine-rich repeat domain-containing protein [Rickettsiella grylli]|uniref:leucine-rich repeat domain-containing protein n=1 Tax=Rickettsiella grylli TaxID=59196 RepID=UPI0009D77D06